MSNNTEVKIGDVTKGQTKQEDEYNVPAPEITVKKENGITYLITKTPLVAPHVAKSGNSMTVLAPNGTGFKATGLGIQGYELMVQTTTYLKGMPVPGGTTKSKALQDVD